ncbi:UbiA prenyltransferase [Agrocybe pediades]|nr:UbiA prenyltransferase [Agrocybe pediades]
MPNTLLEKRKPLSGSLPFCTRAELQACWELCRLHNNIGFWVVWLPTAWSITMAYHAQQSITIIDYFACLLKFFPLCYGIKSLIMTIDDILDADVDGMVARTKMRPIPRGDISLARAWIFFGAQVIIGVPLACVSLSSTSLIVCAIVCPLYVIYPTCKRWTNLAPIPLGIMFKIGIFIGWAELANSQVGSKAVIPWHMLAPIYIGTCMWTITYETVYQHQDKIDDVKIGLHSPALLLGHATVPICTVTATAFFALLTYGGIMNTHGLFYFLGVGVAAIRLMSQLISVDVDKPESCRNFFLDTVRVGQIILGGIVVDTIYYRISHGIPL